MYFFKTGHGKKGMVFVMMKTILWVVIMMEEIVVEIMLRSIDVKNVNAKNADHHQELEMKSAHQAVVSFQKIVSHKSPVCYF